MSEKKEFPIDLDYRPPEDPDFPAELVDEMTKGVAGDRMLELQRWCIWARERLADNVILQRELMTEAASAESRARTAKTELDKSQKTRDEMAVVIRGLEIRVRGMGSTPVISPGSKVNLTGLQSTCVGTVEEARIGRNELIYYLVSYFHDGDYRTVSIHESQVTVDPDRLDPPRIDYSNRGRHAPETEG